MFGNTHHIQYLCGCWYPVPVSQYWKVEKKYLPQVQLSSSTTILATTSRTTLRQTFVNDESRKLEQVQYTFPLYDGVSVVGFTCTVGSKTIVGVVKEKQQARVDYQEAVSRGETAGLLEQLPEASDVFTTSIGNIPPNEKILVEIVYLGELKHDAETDGSRFTIPTVIAPRYGPVSTDSSQVLSGTNVSTKGGISISVDVTLEEGAIVRGLQSPSHPIAVTMGRTSTMDEDSFNNNHASATLTLGSTELDKDFVIVVLAKGTETPRALLETHPSIPNHRALMATLVPKFNIPSISPEIVFVVDRSGSMGGKIELLVAAMKIFLKSLPVGVKFNICSFGSRHSFLFKKSKTYDQSSLKDALKHLESFSANYGGTEMLQPVKETVKNRFNDLPLEVMILTDGEIWNQDELFTFVNATTNARFFTLGIGSGASSALVEGIARAGNGFAQFVGENEKMDKRVVRMLKGALTPHVTDYKLEVAYAAEEALSADDDFEMVDSEKPVIQPSGTATSQKPVVKKPISLFDTNATEQPTNPPAGRYDNLLDVPSPKVLQAPDQIPALFPFNRTTVYLLLGPEATRQVPKSVILRGTSEHGPLELEIPVQDVGTGETIHQLAAKKAVHELEQGRGWITKARNAEDKLLKSAHEGKWDLIVEREAVRLGVQFQVGGKWCSFVAVEKKPGDKSGNPPEYSEKEQKELVVDRGPSQTRKSYPSNSLFGAAVKPDRRHVSPIFPFGSFGNGAFGSGAVSTKSSGPGSLFGGETGTTAATGGLFGASSPTHSGPPPSSSSRNTMQQCGGLFGSSVMNTTAPTGGLFGNGPSVFGSRERDVQEARPSSLFGGSFVPTTPYKTAGRLFGGSSLGFQTHLGLLQEERKDDKSSGPPAPTVTCNLAPDGSVRDVSPDGSLEHWELPFHLPCYVFGASTKPSLDSSSAGHTPGLDHASAPASIEDTLATASTAEMNDADSIGPANMPLPSEDSDPDSGANLDLDLDLSYTGSLERARRQPLASAPSQNQLVGGMAGFGGSAQPNMHYPTRAFAAAAPMAYRAASASAAPAAPAPPPSAADAAILQQYQMSLMTLEQQNKNRLPMARKADVSPAPSRGMAPGGAPRLAPLIGASAQKPGVDLLLSPESTASRARGGAKGSIMSNFFVGSSISSSNDESKAKKASKGGGNGFFRKSSPSSKATRKEEEGGGGEYFDTDFFTADFDLSAEEGAAALATSLSDKMHALIGLQSFDGSWNASKPFYRLVGVDNSNVPSLSKDEAVAVTALAIAWLRKHVRDEEDVWEMVVEKALGWLETKVGKDEAARVLAQASSVV